jgi:hypothetical protein
MNVTIQYSASVQVDGEVRTIAGSDFVEAGNVITGTQTIGDTYEVIGGSAFPSTAIMLHNTGSVDVSIRVQIYPVDTFVYLAFNLTPGATMCIPKTMVSDADQMSFAVAVQARTSSGTADIDYCLIN